MTNIFFRGDIITEYVCEWDKLLRTQEWVNTDVLREKYKWKDDEYEKHIKQSKKAIRIVLAERGMLLQEKRLETQDRRRILTAYPSYNKDPLHDLRILAVIEQAMYYFKSALQITYAPSYHQTEEHIFHAHYQKVYNGRHYVCGIYEKEEENQGLPFVTLAVDRIVEAHTTKEVPYRPGDSKKYEELMKSVLGASPNFKHPEVRRVVLRTHDTKVHKLLLNKPLHDSIREQQPCVEGQTGLLTLHVQLTQELRNSILYYGKGVEVVEPRVLRIQIANDISKMMTYYY